MYLAYTHAMITPIATCSQPTTEIQTRDRPLLEGHLYCNTLVVVVLAVREAILFFPNSGGNYSKFEEYWDPPTFQSLDLSLVGETKAAAIVASLRALMMDRCH
jgi:hypothetical protein